VVWAFLVCSGITLLVHDTALLPAAWGLQQPNQAGVASKGHDHSHQEGMHGYNPEVPDEKEDLWVPVHGGGGGGCPTWGLGFFQCAVPSSAAADCARCPSCWDLLALCLLRSCSNSAFCS
jgi:hypothetical protein